MTMTTGKKLVAALSLGLVSLTGAAATPAFARHHEYRPGDYYRGYDYSRGGYEDGYYRRGNYYDGHRRDRGHYDRDWNYRCRDEGKGGAVIGAIDLSLRKARTAALFETSSEAVWEYCRPGAPAHALEHSNGGLAPFAGGLPIKTPHGVLLGALGVSGGSVPQDLEIAVAAAAAFSA